MIHSVIPPRAVGSPVLFVHGAWHGAWCWERWMSGLGAAGIASHAIDLPGHGRQGDTRRRWWRLGHYVKATVDAIDTLSPGVVVGHSMGGLVVQRALERRSVGLGVLVASVPLSGARGATARVFRRHPVPVVKANATSSMWPIVGTVERTRELFFTPDTPDDVVAATFQRLENESYLAYVEMLTRLPRPSRISTPIRVMAASDDGVFEVAEQQGLAAAYDTVAEVIEQSGHDIMLDVRSGDALEVLRGWIETPVR